MKLLGWQRAVGMLVKVIGIVGVASAAAFVVPAVATIAAGNNDASELLSKCLHGNIKVATDTFPVNSLDYILGDAIFGSLMFASNRPAGTAHTGSGRNASITATPAALLSMGRQRGIS